MKSLKKIYRFFRNKWVSLTTRAKFKIAYFSFIRDFLKFKDKTKKSPQREFSVEWSDTQPFLHDKTADTPFDKHYTYHPAWAARVLKEINPKLHIDISSILHFSTIVSAFIPIKFYDYRPANLNLDNLYSGKADLVSLPFEDNSIESLSCMHTVEHVGLGRYGDPIDPNSDIKAMSELKRVLKKDGNLIFVVPIGKPKVIYNAHRIYSYDQIIGYFSGLKLKEFSLITDDSSYGMIRNATKELSDKQNYGCGCFWFKK